MASVMKISLMLSLLLLLGHGAVVLAGQTSQSIVHNGNTRSFQVFLPETLDPAEAPALLVVLHGLRGNGQRIADMTGFNERASQHGFIVVYPDSLGSRWNYLYGIPGAFAGPDDPGFLHKLTDTLSNTYNIDSGRRYVVGISNGGFMAQRLACEAQPRYAGFASIAAGGYAVLPEHCGRQAPIDALYVHGTADRLVPWEGKKLEDSSGNRQIVTLSVTDSLKFWAGHNGCAASIDVHDIPAGGRSTGTRVRVYASRDCVANSSVSLYAVIGGGHNWPGVEGAIPPSIAGRVNLDIHASEVVWSFFDRHQSGP